MVNVDGAEPIAIIGMAVRVPGAADARQFWRNLVDGVESVTSFTRDEQLARGADPEEVDDPSWVHAAPMIPGFDEFDAGLFGMSDREAQITDPQHRLLLQACYATLEDAGYDPARYDGDIGLYAGSGANNYMWLNVNRNRRIVESQRAGISIFTGNQASYLATNVSYRLDLRGPSLSVYTACSTSLVAMHLACEALRNGECEMALVGGVNLEIPHGVGYFGVEGFTSPDGRCRPFDARANGTVWGSGLGVVLLKRLSEAVADADTVRAVVLGNAINNDGATKVGFSAPSMDGQMAAIEQAVAVADVDPRTITYVEAHGTGTAMGDPLEVAALSAVYGKDAADRGWCGLGSVKSNIGHLSQAAGVVSVIKTVLAMEHGLIPPSINFVAPNPAIDFASTPFYLTDTLTKWEPDGIPRRAGVSSFGVGGTNAHVILQEAPRPARPRRGDERPAHLLRVSARTPEALAAATGRLADELAARPDLDLADVAHTLDVGRVAHRHRTAVVARDPDDAIEALRDPRRQRTGAAVTAPPVAFLFSGQGAQYAGMAAGLYSAEKVFAAAVDDCVSRLDLDRDLRDLMFATGPAAEEELRQTRYTQPALFVVEYALAELWRSWGVRPSAMIGHSIGEYVAATVAGVFDVGDALRLVSARGRLMQSMPAGAMLAVALDEDEVAPHLPDDVTVATVNGPGACVVAGPVGSVDALAERLAAREITAKRLRTSHAFHSAMMEPIRAEFAAMVAAVPRRAPRLRFVSNVTGDWITEAQATDAGYWADHLRRPVRFGAGVATLLAGGQPVMVECGPGGQLVGLVRGQLPKGAPAPVATLPGPNDRTGDVETLLTAAGALWAAGVPATAGRGGARVPLPTYPFENKRHWVDPDPAEGSPPLAARRGPRPLDRWFATPVWRQLGASAEARPLGRCLVFVDEPAEDAVGGEGGLVARLRAAGADLTVVRPGPAFAATNGGFTVRPGDRSDYDMLIAALGEAAPERIVHALALGTATGPAPLVGHPAGDGPTTATDGGVAAAWAAQEHGLFSLLWLVQAVTAAGVADGMRLDVVTRGAAGVTGADLSHPEHATVAAIARVVPLEVPGLTVRWIDADGADPDAVVAELARSGPAEVALRAGRRWMGGYEPVEVPAGGPDRLRERGRYLITGGLGGIGLTIAEDLARRVRARLVLVSRAGLPPRADWPNHPADSRVGRAIAAIRRMERAGADIHVMAVDVADPIRMREVRREIDEVYGGLDGIVHAAGVPGAGMAEVKDRAAVESVLAPKLAGVLALRAAFADRPLDFVALCSSITAVTGDFGQVDYCAANAFLDAYAAADHGFAAPVVSHNWGGWSEVGMAAEVAAPALLRGNRGEASQPVDHPVLTARSGTECHGVIAPATHWVLDQHRIDGVPVVPGTAHLEAVRATVEACLPRPSDAHAVELRDVAFLAPLGVTDSAEYRVTLAGDQFEVTSRIAGRTTVHARGTTGWVDPGPAAPVDVAAIESRCRPVPDEGHRSSLLTFGPRWDALRDHVTGVDEELARIVAPRPAATPRPAAERWGLEPALLDVATAFGTGRGNGSYLPLGYGRVLVRAPLPDTFVSHLRYTGDGDEVVTADLTLCDGDGRVLVEISDFTLRRVDPDAVGAGLAVGAGPAVEAAGTAPGTAPGVGAPGGGAPGTDPAPDGMIRPVDGAEAFRRALAPFLGSRVVISTVPVDELFARRVSAADLAEVVAGPAAAVVATVGDVVAPRTTLEATLVELWQAVLGVDAVSVDQDFFGLGGNSLVAVQLIAQIRKATGIRLPMRALFDTPTIAELAVYIDGLPKGDGPDEGSGDGPQTTIPRLRR